jgi:hypothetical protein
MTYTLLQETVIRSSFYYRPFVTLTILCAQSDTEGLEGARHLAVVRSPGLSLSSGLSAMF